MATTLSSTSSSTQLALAQSQAGSASSAKEIQDQFLTLLVTQLQNQDPLNPMDNAELTSQLAQISTVEGVTNLSDTLLAISGQIDVTQSMNAVSMIGKGVFVPGSKVALGTRAEDPTVREATPFGVDLQGNAATVTVKIMDSSGAVVRTIALENQSTGVLTFNWDGASDSGGQVADGSYNVSVSAVDANGNAVVAEALTYGEVGSVAYSTDGLRLDLGLAGQYSLLDVRKVFES